METADALNPALVLYYPLKGDARNHAGEGADGEPSPNVTYAPGRWGSAADFTKPGAHIAVRGLDRYTRAYTYSAWVKLQALRGIDEGGGDYGTIFGPFKVHHATGRLMFFFDYDNSRLRERTYMLLHSSDTLTPNEWHHVLVTYDHENRRLLFCIDGRLDSVHSVADMVAPTDRPRLCVRTIGGWIRQGGATYDSTLNGWVGDAALFEVAINQDGLSLLSGLRTFPSLECAEDCLGVHIGGDSKKRVAFALLAIPVVLTAFGITVAQYWLNQVSRQPTDHPEPTLEEIARRIRECVGSPARPGIFVRRSDVGISKGRRIHLDIGGEGYHEVDGVRSGFVDAINVNAQTHDSQPPYGPIPNLVQVARWETNPSYPFEDGFADYVTMQGAPLTDKGISEMARVLRHGGEIALWIDTRQFESQINKLAMRLNSMAVLDPRDEFNGAAGFPKMRIICRRK